MNKEYLRSLLYYNPNDGSFLWRKTVAARAIAGTKAGSVNSKGYVKITINKKIYSAHRLAFLYINGSFPEDQVDHIDHNRENNKWSNLREVSNKKNSKNQSQHIDNTSGTTGVWLNRKSDKWCAQININSKRINLGTFINYLDAVVARKHAEKIYKFHTNHGIIK